MKAGLLASAVLLAAAGAVPRGAALPPLGDFPLPSYAVQDVSMAMAGARRFGGDVAFIEFLQYVAGTEGVEARHDHDHALEDDHGAGRAHTHAAWLPRALPHALRMVSVTPYFHSAHLLAAGMLGFVLDRPGEAVDVLQRAAQADPTFWRYRLYAGAIAYRDDERPDKVIALLEQALAYPDCPSLLQNILANLHKKNQNYVRAAQIYTFTAETSKDAAAVDTARRHLAKMREEGLIP